MLVQRVCIWTKGIFQDREFLDMGETSTLVTIEYKNRLQKRGMHKLLYGSGFILSINSSF